MFIPWLWYSTSGENGKRVKSNSLFCTFSPLLPIYFVSAEKHSCAKGLIWRWLAEKKMSLALSNQKPPHRRRIKWGSQKRAETRRYFSAGSWGSAAYILIDSSWIRAPTPTILVYLTSVNHFRSNHVKNSPLLIVVFDIEKCAKISSKFIKKNVEKKLKRKKLWRISNAEFWK